MIKCLKCGSDDYSKIVKNINYFAETKKHYCTDCFKFCNNCKQFLSIENFTKKKKGIVSCCKKCTNEKRIESRKKKKNDLSYQLSLSVKETIILENKQLLKKYQRLCCGCHNPFSIYDLIRGRYCKNCSSKYTY